MSTMNERMTTVKLEKLDQAMSTMNDCMTSEMEKRSQAMTTMKNHITAEIEKISQDMTTLKSYFLGIRSQTEVASSGTTLTETSSSNMRAQ